MRRWSPSPAGFSVDTDPVWGSVAEIDDPGGLRVQEPAQHSTFKLDACGGFLGLNDNYAAGVLENLAHFQPEVGEWIGAEDWSTLAARGGGWHPCA